MEFGNKQGFALTIKELIFYEMNSFVTLLDYNQHINHKSKFYSL